MHIKFGQFKRYGLEGAESAMPAMESIFTTASKHGLLSVSSFLFVMAM